MTCAWRVHWTENLDVEQLSEISGEDMAAAITSVHGRLNISG